jgi:hypothetical protein
VNSLLRRTRKISVQTSDDICFANHQSAAELAPAGILSSISRDNELGNRVQPIGKSTVEQPLASLLSHYSINRQDNIAAANDTRSLGRAILLRSAINPRSASPEHLKGTTNLPILSLCCF